MALEKEDIMALIAILQKGLVDNEPAEDVSPKKTTTKKKRSYSKTASKKEDKPKRKNLFETMPERNMHKEDVEIDKRLRKYPITERSRKLYMIDVQCRVCGKKEKVSPVLCESPDRYKCNKCASSAG